MYLNMQIPFLGLWSQWNLPVGPLMNEGSSRVYPVCSHHTVKALCLQSPSFRSNYCALSSSKSSPFWIGRLNYLHKNPGKMHR